MNLLGEGFPNEIIRQIEQRQKVYGSGYSNTTRSSEEIVYLNANTAWCKLISSTNIDKIEAINNPTIKKLGLKGSDLARKFILFNGTVDTTTNEQRGGINYQNDPLGGNNASLTAVSCSPTLSSLLIIAFSSNIASLSCCVGDCCGCGADIGCGALGGAVGAPPLSCAGNCIPRLSNAL